jgi:hypothetical protein
VSPATIALSATPLLVLLAYVPGGMWLLPILAPLTLYPTFQTRVKSGDVRGAWLAGMAWAILLSVGVIILTQLAPETAARGILNGEPYRKEMFGWIMTGIAPENSPRQFLPIHLLHLSLFALLTYVSAGYLGLVLGAALTGYMSYFVGSYAAASHHPLLGSLVAWVPWSVIRVAAFVLLGALLARPLLLRRRWPFERQEARLFALVAAGIAADLLLKTLTAPVYGRALRSFSGGVLGPAGF